MKKETELFEEYLEELSKRQQAYVACKDDGGYLQQIKDQLQRRSQLVKEITKQMWDGEAVGVPATMAESNAIDKIAFVERERQRVQEQATTVPEPAPPPCIADGLDERVKVGVPVLQEKELVEVLRSHFSEQLQGLHTLRTNYARLHKYNGTVKSDVQGKIWMNHLAKVDAAIVDCTARVTRLGGHAPLTAVSAADPYPWEKLAGGSWQLSESDVRAMVRGLVFRHVTERTARAFYVRLCWLPHSHRAHIREKVISLFKAKGAEHASFPSMVPVMQTQSAALNERMDYLKAFFGLGAQKNNRLYLAIQQLTRVQMEEQNRLMAFVSRVAAPATDVPEVQPPQDDAGPGLRSPRRSQLSQAEPAGPAHVDSDADTIYLESVGVDYEAGAYFQAPLGVGSMMGTAPSIAVENALRAENVFLEVTDVDEMLKRVEELAQTHVKRAQKPPLMTKNQFLASVTGRPSLLHELGSDEGAKGRGDSESDDDNQHEHLADRIQGLDVSERQAKVMQGLYSLQTVLTRSFKLRVLHALNVVVSVMARLHADARREEALARPNPSPHFTPSGVPNDDDPSPTDSSGERSDIAKLIVEDTYEEHSMVGWRVKNLKGEQVMYKEAVEHFHRLQQDLLQVGSHCIENMRQTMRQSAAQQGGAHLAAEAGDGVSVDYNHLLQDLYEMEANFVGAKVSLLLAYLKAYHHTVDPLSRSRLRLEIAEVAARRPELRLSDAYFMDGYASSTLSLQLELSVVQGMLKQQCLNERRQRQMLYQAPSRVVQQWQEVGALEEVGALDPSTSADLHALVPGAPLPLLYAHIPQQASSKVDRHHDDARQTELEMHEEYNGQEVGETTTSDTRNQEQMESHDSEPASGDHLRFVPSGEGRDAMNYDIYSSVGVISLFPAMIRASVAQMTEACQGCHLEKARIRQVVMEHVALLWELTLHEETMQPRLPPSSIEKHHSKLLTLSAPSPFMDHALAVDVLFKLALKPSNPADMNIPSLGSAELDSVSSGVVKDEVKRAAGVLRLVTCYHKLHDALEETRVLAATYTVQGHLYGRQIETIELAPLDFAGTAVHKHVEDYEQSCDLVTVPPLHSASSRLALAAAQFDPSLALIDTTSVRGLQELVGTGEDIGDMVHEVLKTQWVESLTLAGAITHNSTVLDCVWAVQMRKIAALSAQVLQEEAEEAALAMRRFVINGGGPAPPSSVFLTSVNDGGRAVSAEHLLGKVEVTAAMQKQVLKVTQDLIVALDKHRCFMSATAIKLPLRSAAVHEYTKRTLRSMSKSTKDTASTDLKRAILGEYRDKLMAGVLPRLQRVQVAKASKQLRRVVAMASSADTRRSSYSTGPFPAHAMEVMHMEGLALVEVDDDATSALGMRKPFWERAHNSADRHHAEYSMVHDNGALNQLWGLMGPMEALQLPLKLEPLRTTTIITQALVDILALRWAVLSLTVPDGEYEETGHAYPSLMHDVNTLCSELENIQMPDSTAAIQEHLLARRGMLVLRHSVMLERAAQRLAASAKDPQAWAITNDLRHSLHESVMFPPRSPPRGLTAAPASHHHFRILASGLGNNFIGWTDASSAAAPVHIAVAIAQAAATPLEVLYAFGPSSVKVHNTGLIPPAALLHLRTLSTADRTLVANEDLKIGLIVEAKIADDQLYSLTQPRQKIQSVTYLLRTHLLHARLRALFGQMHVEGLRTLCRPTAACPSKAQVEQVEALFAARVSDHAGELRAWDLSDQDLMRLDRVDLLLSSPGRVSRSIHELRRLEWNIFRLKQMVDERCLQGILDHLHSDCQGLLRDCAALYPNTLGQNPLYFRELVSGLTRRLKGMKRTSAAPAEGTHGAEDTAAAPQDGDGGDEIMYIVSEASIVQWLGEVVGRVLVHLERVATQKLEGNSRLVNELRLALRDKDQQMLRMASERKQERKEMLSRIRAGVCDHGLALFYKIYRLKRALVNKDQELAAQEGKLRDKIKLEYEERMLELEREVTVAETNMHKSRIETRERLAQDMLKLRREATLKLMNKEWSKDLTGAQARANHLEDSLAVMTLKAEQYQKTMLMMTTLSKLRSKVRDTALKRRLQVSMLEYERNDALAWDELGAAQAKAQLLEEQLTVMRRALVSTTTELRAAKDSAVNEKRQKGKLVQWKVKAMRDMREQEQELNRLTKGRGVRASGGPTRDAENASPRDAGRNQAAGTGAAGAAALGRSKEGNVSERLSPPPPDSATRREVSLQREIKNLKAKLVMEQKLKQDAMEQVHDMRQARRAVWEGTPQELARLEAAGDGPLFIDQMQSEIWQQKFREQSVQVRQLEAENESMRRALKKIESLAPGMTTNLVPSDDMLAAQQAARTMQSGPPSPTSTARKVRPSSAVLARRSGVPRPTSAPFPVSSRLYTNANPTLPANARPSTARTPASSRLFQ